MDDRFNNNETIEFGSANSDLGETSNMLFLLCIYNKQTNRFTKEALKKPIVPAQAGTQELFES